MKPHEYRGGPSPNPSTVDCGDDKGNLNSLFLTSIFVVNDEATTQKAINRDKDVS